MSNQNNKNIPQNVKVYSNGILTSLLLPRKQSKGCVWFIIAFTCFTLAAVAILSIVFFVNASKIFSNIGRYALTPTMQAIDSDVPPADRAEFSNAYIKIFNHIEEKGITGIEPWSVNAMTNLAASAKDHKISSNECAAFIELVEKGSNNVTNKSGIKK
jgi:hypothetical protein